MPSSDPPGGTSPKLTAGQRLLLLLPRLQRPQRPSTPPPDQGRSKGTGAGGGATGNTPAAGKATAGKAAAVVPLASGTSANGTSTNGSAVNGKANGKTSGKATTPVETATPPPTLGARLRDSMLKPKPEPKVGPSGKAPTKADPYPDKSSAELRDWIKYLDDQERLYTLMAAPIAAILAITSLFIGLRDDPAVGAKNHVSPDTIVIEGLVVLALSVAVLVSGLIRRRSFAMFALAFVGFGMDSTVLSVFGVIPFWGLAGWMFMRSSRMQRALTTRGDHPRQVRGRSGGSGGRAGSRPSGSAGRSRRKKAPEPVGPPPSKRYTPPKPKDDDR